MLHLNWYNFFLKLVVFVSFINLFNCEFCSIQTNCQCQIKNITNSVVSAHSNEIQLILDSNINICTQFPNSSKTDPPNSNLKYELNCTSLIYLNESFTELNNPTQFTNNGTDSFTAIIKYPCPAPPKKAKGYSTGSILVIIFFTISFAYLGLGVSVNYFLVGARGVEMIPNLDFWKDFPALVLDGMKFLQNGCTARPSDLSAPSGAEGYDAI